MSFQVERGRSESKAKTFKENRSGRTPLNADPRVGNLATKASSAAARSSDAEGGGIRSRTPRCRDHEPQEISHTQQAEKSSAEGAPYPDGATLLASPRSSVDRAAGLATGRPCLGRCWRVHGLFGVAARSLAPGGALWHALGVMRSRGQFRHVAGRFAGGGNAAPSDLYAIAVAMTVAL